MAGSGLPGSPPAGLWAVAEEEEEPQCTAPRSGQPLEGELADLRWRVKKQESRISELATYAGVVQKESIAALAEKVERLCARTAPEAERPAEEDEAPQTPRASERLAAQLGPELERRLAEELALVRQQVQEALAPKAALEAFVQGLAAEMREAFEALRGELQLQSAESQAGLSTLQVQMEGYRLQAVGGEASVADLRAELDRRAGTEEQAAQSFLSGVCRELRETQRRRCAPCSTTARR
ncbi:unnamed protein product [Prorocentrum cordatum]|uniref:Uncharacterized protein n=1 Tax=Prorocentrum cordatum TaxID=2364126 RepID=A0ABN9VEE7_9DINO|nr:unnamed protein product [Polarella glacialis]